MKTKLIILAALCIAIASVSGCGYKEGVTIQDTKAYLWFTGESEGVSLYLDAQDPIELAPSYYTDDQGSRRPRNKPVYYEIDPGKHTIKLMRSGQVILERNILIGNHMTREIEIP